MMWSRDSDDCRTSSPADVAARLAPDALSPGDIVLLHEAQDWTLAALPPALEALAAAGWQAVTVGEILEPPRPDHGRHHHVRHSRALQLRRRRARRARDGDRHARRHDPPRSRRRGPMHRADGRVALAHRRLSIVDLSAAGHQPMSNEDGTVWITFNGEIYNHADLRPGLDSKGHTFRSRTDTEAILHLYEESAEDCLRRWTGCSPSASGTSRAPAAARARSAGQEAALLHGHRRPAAVRVRDQGPAPASRTCAATSIPRGSTST